MRYLSFWLASAISTLDFDQAEVVFKRLQGGYTVDEDEATGMVTISYSDGTPLFRIHRDELAKPLAVWEFV